MLPACSPIAPLFLHPVAAVRTIDDDPIVWGTLRPRLAFRSSPGSTR